MTRKNSSAAHSGAADAGIGKNDSTAFRKGKRMTDVERSLIRKATEIHATIYPCPPQKDFAHCFTRDNGKVYFWFNTHDKSTHVVIADAKN